MVTPGMMVLLANIPVLLLSGFLIWMGVDAMRIPYCIRMVSCQRSFG